MTARRQSISSLDRGWRWLLATLAGAAVLGSVAPTARAGPCVPATTLDECELLVSSRLTDQVLRYDGITGNFLGEFVTAGSGGLDVPFGVTFGPDGNLYVGSGGSSPRVKRYDGTTGDFIDDFTPETPDGAPVWLIAFGPDDNLYGVVGNAVLRWNGITGESMGTFVDLGLGGVATSFTFGPDGNVYVSSFLTNEVLQFDGTTGGLVGPFAEIPIPGTDGNPGQVAFRDGYLYVGLPNTGNDILRFDASTGDFVGAFIPEPDPHPDGPLGFVFGPDEDLYVPSRDTDEVLRYDGTTGAFIDVFASGGGLSEPTSLAFVPEPGQALLAATGALVLAAVRRRRSSS